MLRFEKTFTRLWSYDQAMDIVGMARVKWIVCPRWSALFLSM